jgi:hypothetical protein
MSSQRVEEEEGDLVGLCVEVATSFETKCLMNKCPDIGFVSTAVNFHHLG